MRTGMIRTLAAAAALACGACGTTDAPRGAAPLEIGAIYNTSGAQAVLDVPSRRGSELAAAQINAAGGLFGHPLRLVAVEGNSSPESIARGTEALLAEHPMVLALVGLSDTDMVLAAAPAIAAHDRVLMTSGATSPKLPSQVPDRLYLACFGDNVQAAAGAEWAFDALGARRVVVVHDPNLTYPRLLQGYFVTRFTELGGEILANHAIQPRAEDVVLPAVGTPDLVFLSVETAEDACRVVPLLRAAGYSGPILGGDGYDAGEVWAAHADLADVYFTTHAYLGADSPNPRVAPFLAAYAEAHPGEQPSSFAALGYDAVGLLAAAIRRSRAATPSGVNEGLAGLTGYEGVTGTIQFDGTERIPRKTVTLLRVVGGCLTHVRDVLPREVPAP